MPQEKNDNRKILTEIPKAKKPREYVEMWKKVKYHELEGTFSSYKEHIISHLKTGDTNLKMFAEIKHTAVIHAIIIKSLPKK